MLFSFFVSQINYTCLAKGCHHQYAIVGDTLYNPGDSINTTFRVLEYGDCVPSGNCTFTDFQWYRNGTALAGETNYQYMAADTGLYQVYYISDCSGSESTSFHIGYYGGFTQINEPDTKKNSPFIYADGSSIFRINMAGKKLRQLIVSENSGRLVLSISNPVSEINLGDFAPGIYYYTIYDEEKNFWRGKIVNE